MLTFRMYNRRSLIGRRPYDVEKVGQRSEASLRLVDAGIDKAGIDH
jgi:hypothetical protein